jgi:hypothetical protein
MHLRKRWIDRRVYEYFAVNLGSLLGWKNPILVYQMGGVGSSAMRNSLFRSHDPKTRLVLMSHEFTGFKDRCADDADLPADLSGHFAREIEHYRAAHAALSPLARALWLFRKKLYVERIRDVFISKRRPVKVITLVREPVAANVSLFFQVLGQFMRSDGRRGLPEISEIVDVFIERYTHFRPMTWFDVELKQELGIDVYEHEFPTDKGHLRISSGLTDLLILRSELDDGRKAEAVADFLGLPQFRLVRSNVADDKPYAVAYREFRDKLVLPQELLDEIYTSRYALHFYSARERAACRARWGG